MWIVNLLLIALTIKKHCFYQYKELSLHLKSRRSYFNITACITCLNLESMSLFIRIERLWSFMYERFNFRRTATRTWNTDFNRSNEWSLFSSLFSSSSIIENNKRWNNSEHKICKQRNWAVIEVFVWSNALNMKTFIVNSIVFLKSSCLSNFL